MLLPVPFSLITSFGLSKTASGSIESLWLVPLAFPAFLVGWSSAIVLLSRRRLGGSPLADRSLIDRSLTDPPLLLPLKVGRNDRLLLCDTALSNCMLAIELNSSSTIEILMNWTVKLIRCMFALDSFQVLRNSCWYKAVASVRLCSALFGSVQLLFGWSSTSLIESYLQLFG